MNPMNQYEKEEEAIIKAEAEGRITKDQMWKELRELQRDYRDSAHESAREAYERELDRW